MRPLRGRTNPLTLRSSVVLPAPLAPRTAVMVAASTSSDTPSRARTAPYVVTTSSICSIADLSGLRVDLLAEVGLQHLRVVANLVRSAGRDAAAEVEHDDPVTDLHDEIHVVLDQQHGHPAAEVADETAQL